MDTVYSSKNPIWPSDHEELGVPGREETDVGEPADELVLVVVFVESSLDVDKRRFRGTPANAEFQSAKADSERFAQVWNAKDHRVFQLSSIDLGGEFVERGGRRDHAIGRHVDRYDQSLEAFDVE